MSQTLLADYAVPLDPRDVQAAGYIGALRYVAPPDVKYDWKRFTTHERDAIFGQTTLGVLLVFESYAGRALAGAIAGAQDAHTAIQAAQALGYPSSVPLFLACDTDATADQVRPYYQAATNAWVNIGVYGGINVVDALLADGTVRWGWQTVAWSGGRVSQKAHLYQRLRPTTNLVDHHAGEFDEDVQLKPIPLWRPQPPQPRPQPQPLPAHLTGGSVFIYQVTDGPSKDVEIYDYGFGPVHISGPESVELVAAGVKVVPISGSTFANRFAGVK